MATGGTPAAFLDFDPIAVDMQPGYRYDVEMSYPVMAATQTAVPFWTAYYRLRTASTATYGAWIAMENGTHEIDATGPRPGLEASDAAFGVTVTDPVDAIEIGALCTEPGVTVNTRCSYARIVEYMP